MQPIISFDGRMARVQFIVQVIAAKVAFILSIVGIVFLYELLLKLHLDAIAELVSTLPLIVLAVALVVLWFIVTFSALYRRLRDIDVRGGWGLAILAGLAVPIIYAICLLVLAIVPGTRGKNQYDI
jgi:uncharacterized membrane protein YhaH (DUF805 family)